MNLDFLLFSISSNSGCTSHSLREFSSATRILNTIADTFVSSAFFPLSGVRLEILRYLELLVTKNRGKKRYS